MLERARLRRTKAGPSTPFAALRSLRMTEHGDDLWRQLTEHLLDGDGFGQVAGLVYVAAAPDGDVVGEQLQRHDLDERGEQLHGGRDVDDVLDEAADGCVAFGGYGDDAAGAGGYFLD